jgi:hypothetical protein
VQRSSLARIKGPRSLYVFLFSATVFIGYPFGQGPPFKGMSCRMPDRQRIRSC